MSLENLRLRQAQGLQGEAEMMAILSMFGGFAVTAGLGPGNMGEVIQSRSTSTPNKLGEVQAANLLMSGREMRDLSLYVTQHKNQRGGGSVLDVTSLAIGTQGVDAVGDFVTNLVLEHYATSPRVVEATLAAASPKFRQLASTAAGGAIAEGVRAIPGIINWARRRIWGDSSVGGASKDGVPTTLTSTASASELRGPGSQKPIFSSHPASRGASATTNRLRGAEAARRGRVARSAMKTGMRHQLMRDQAADANRDATAPSRAKAIARRPAARRAAPVKRGVGPSPRKKMRRNKSGQFVSTGKKTTTKKKGVKRKAASKKGAAKKKRKTAPKKKAAGQKGKGVRFVLRTE